MAPAMVFTALSLDVGMLVPALVVTFGHALVLGLPAVLLFHYKRWSNSAAAVAVGFVIGALPVGVLVWPLRPGSGISTSSSSAPTVVDGIPTWAGWLEYLVVAGGAGLLGALGSLVFWVTLSALRALPTND